jgi:hypothetical protein
VQSISGYESVRKYFSLGDIDGGCGAAFSPNTSCNAVFPSMIISLLPVSYYLCTLQSLKPFLYS